MVRYYENSSTYQFNWNQVVAGFWQRYPNPNSLHVLTEDTISRHIKDGLLYTTRLITKTSGVPKWGERFLTRKMVRIIEESIVDPKTETLTTYTRNWDCAKAMNVTEKVVYKVSDKNPNWTVANKSAWIESHIFGLSRAIEKLGLDRFKIQSARMYDGFNYVLARKYPDTAKLINPPLPKLEYPHKHDDGTKGSLTEDLQHSLQDKAEKMKDAAKKAASVAKKARAIYVA